MIYSANFPFLFHIYKDSATLRIEDIELNQIIYNGKVYKYPNAYAIEVDISTIVQNYLNTDIYSIDSDKNVTHQYIKNYELVRRFNIYIDDDAPITQWFAYNWNEYPTHQDQYIANNPISTIAYYGQLLFFNINSINLSSSVNIYLNSTALGSYVSDTSQMVMLNVGNIAANEGDTINFDSNIGNVKYNYSNCSPDWVVYYINTTGGMDTLPLFGKMVVSDNLDRNEITRNFRTGTNQFGRVITNTVTSQRYEANTGWIEENKVPILSELFTSPKIYLHNIWKNDIIPVILTNKSFEYKTFENTKSLINYSLSFDSSQFEIRK